MTQQIPLLGIYSEKTIIEKSMFTNVHCSTIYRHRSPRYLSIDECIKKLCYIYSGILLNHKKESFEPVLMRWMNLEPIIQWSKSEREKAYINAYIWTRERWYWWTYLQVSNGDADIENRFTDTELGEGEGGTNGESSIESCVLSCLSCVWLCDPMD